MRKLVIFCLCLLTSSLAFGASVMYESNPGLSSHSLFCRMTNQHGGTGHLSSDGPLHGPYSLDESIGEVNQYIKDPDYVDITLNVTLFCHNGTHATYHYENDRMRDSTPIIMKAPQGCR